jgi:Nickel responsive protein SCO4226-like
MAEESAEGRQTFLVEHFRPGAPADGLRRDASRLRGTAQEMEREGKAVRHVRSTIVPGDEFFLCIFDAASEELVREAYARAGITFQRISTALGDEE